MKKILSVAILVLMLITFISPVTASTVNVSTTVAEAYTISIPATLNLTEGNNETTFTVGITDAHIAPGKAVKFSLGSATGTLKHQDDESVTIPYSINEGENAFDGVSFTQTGTENLTIKIETSAWESAAAGIYKDTLTFTVVCE